MSDDQENNSELLVHSSAATSRVDDERYQAQAQACLNFRPVRRRVLGSVLVGGEEERDRDRVEDGSSRGKRARLMEDDRVERGPARSPEVLRAPVRRGMRPETGIEMETLRGLAQSLPITPGEVTGRASLPMIEVATPVMVMSAPSAKYRTSFELRESFFSAYVPTPPPPSLPEHKEDPIEDETSYGSSCFDSWDSIPNTIPDSQEAVPQLPSSPFSEEELDVISQTIFPEADVTSDEELEDLPPPSSPPVIEELEIIPQTIAPAIDPSQEEKDHAPSSSSEKCISPAISSVSFTYNQKTCSAGRPSPIPPPAPGSPTASDSATESLPLEEPAPVARSRQPQWPIPALVEGPYYFFPPVPETSSNPPTVSKNLRKIWNVGQVRAHYQKQKLSQSREIRELERGCWRMDMSGWTKSEDKIHFWNALKDHVTSGRFGWVSVFLDEEKTGNVIKVYCFGGCAQHVCLGSAAYIER
ncbi:unnamed protein product [Tuber melanosporum]|uniref:(Perigord truffle) hypothetical protein n=1 Tax=Tuber melanosporum (strain Mel28) TaxID=656061 RepID=D5G5Y6_TUBMM|nr:uncharacterized protein GSTUM_00001627001 [Tuber melanosporum]CAZ79929.1 unnamed protein product [Tuber melanosporum]